MVTECITTKSQKAESLSTESQVVGSCNLFYLLRFRQVRIGAIRASVTWNLVAMHSVTLSS
jgi:hypothetical protein